MTHTWIDFCEEIANDRAEDQQNSDYDDSHQNKDQSIFDQALALFLWSE